MATVDVTARRNLTAHVPPTEDVIAAAALSPVVSLLARHRPLTWRGRAASAVPGAGDQWAHR